MLTPVKANTIYSLDIDDGVATPSEIVSGTTEYDTGIKYTIATAQTVKEVSGEDYFTVDSTIFQGRRCLRRVRSGRRRRCCQPV